jgi:cytochrome c553
MPQNATFLSLIIRNYFFLRIFPIEIIHIFIYTVLMRLVTAIVMLAAIILISYPVCAEKASTIDELAARYSIDICAGCHEEKHSEWKSSTMGNSVIDLRVLGGWRTFIKLELDKDEALSRKDLTICISCHVPQIEDAVPELVEHIAELVITALEDKEDGKREAAIKELSKLNLNCLGCHNLKALGFDKIPEKDVIYTPNEIDGSAHRAAGFRTIKSDFLKTPGFCAQCHHCPPSVPWEDCPTLYTTYIEDYVNRGGDKTCQDCHMPGEERSHKFFGPDDPEFLKSALSIDLRARPTKIINAGEGEMSPAMVIEVSLRNHAGHVIPHG